MGRHGKHAAQPAIRQARQGTAGQTISQPSHSNTQPCAGQRAPTHPPTHQRPPTWREGNCTAADRPPGRSSVWMHLSRDSYCRAKRSRKPSLQAAESRRAAHQGVHEEGRVLCACLCAGRLWVGGCVAVVCRSAAPLSCKKCSPGLHPSNLPLLLQGLSLLVQEGLQGETTSRTACTSRTT